MQPRKKQLKLKDIDREIIKFCDKPRRSREIVKQFQDKDKFVQPRISRLKVNGYLDIIEMEEGTPGHNWLYIKGHVEEAPKPKKYKPVGICVFGVWL